MIVAMNQASSKDVYQNAIDHCKTTLRNNLLVKSKTAQSLKQLTWDIGVLVVSCCFLLYVLSLTAFLCLAQRRHSTNTF